jgi:hypothetical protein
MVSLLLQHSNRTLVAFTEHRITERRIAARRARRDLLSAPRAACGITMRLAPVARRTVACVLTVVAVVGCDRDAGASAKRDASSAAQGEALAATPGFTRQAAPYTARALDVIGRVTGSVEIEGNVPPDSVVQPTSDQTVCGTSFTRRSVERRGNQAVGVIVWIDGLRAGKPIPLERRFEIVNERCLLVPEVQPAIAGGTLNVRNVDALEHRTRITRRDGGELLATIRETDEGQVVPNEHVLAKPGVLELSCAAHSWTHGWIAVFDHPYFTTTGTDGSFVIDSVPPGRYQLHAWHPRLGAMEESLTIEAGKAAAVTLRARAGP